jgi:hypothetical protein
LGLRARTHRYFVRDLFVGFPCSHAEAGHLEAVCHVFAYLKQHLNYTLVFDERLPAINEESFTEVDWKGFYGTEKEELPPKMPKARGNSVRISCFVYESPPNSYEEEVFGIALLLSDWQGGKVGRRRLIPWSRLVRVNSEKPGITLGVRFVDLYFNHRIAGTVSMRLWWDICAFVCDNDAFVWDNDALVMSLGRLD